MVAYGSLSNYGSKMEAYTVGKRTIGSQSDSPPYTMSLPSFPFSIMSTISPLSRIIITTDSLKLMVSTTPLIELTTELVMGCSLCSMLETKMESSLERSVNWVNRGFFFPFVCPQEQFKRRIVRIKVRYLIRRKRKTLR